MKDIAKEGAISEWNEGNLKSIRLHEAQTIINFSKMNLLARSPNGDGFNYELWIKAVGTLYGEGKSKYKPTEREEIDQIEEAINKTMELMPVHILVVEDSMYSKKQKFIFNKTNWDNLKKLGEMYETKVKIYNDKHGLSTRNASEGGLF